MKKTGVLFFPAFDWSLGESHPEREERLLFTQEQILEEGIMDLPQIKEYSPDIAGIEDVLLAQAIFPHYNKQDLQAHLIAAGSAMILGKALMDKEIKNGFALVRPPGHHSGATNWGNRGFCSLNNEAILVNHLRSAYGVKKVAIIDTDVHHGDGTQDIFYHDPNVLFMSVHQDGRTLYPGSGFVTEKGGPNAWGSTINIPLMPGVGDEGLLFTLENWILPSLASFKPDLVINSAGQDNHFTDPLASMNVSARGYGKITELLRPDLAVLEGGYSIQGALPYVNMAILLALAGEDYSNVIETQKPQRDEIKGKTFLSFYQSLRKEAESVHPQWHIRNESFLPSGDWVYQERNVFYDTEWFQENRKEYVRKCEQCGGTVLIFSQNLETYEKGILIRVPFQACNSCENAGYDLLEQFSKKEKSILFQNQHRNKLQFYHNSREVVIRES